MKNKPWWVGIRATDIENIENLFTGAIPQIGALVCKDVPCRSVDSHLGQRLDHNNPANHHKIDSAINEIIDSIISEDAAATFFFQDQLCFSSSEKLWQRSVYNNRLDILTPLNDKGVARSLFCRHVPTLGSTTLFVSDIKYLKLCEQYKTDKFVAQIANSAGGNGSYLIDSQDSAERLRAIGGCHMVLSEYKPRMSPMNSHIVIYPTTTIVLPPSGQIVSIDNSNRLRYGGCDFYAGATLPQEMRGKIDQMCNKVGESLRRIGYRGVAGVDYLIGDDQALFVEINPRFQASTALLNKILLSRGLPSVHEMHIGAFDGSAPPILPLDLIGHGSMILIFNSENLSMPSAGHFVLRSPDTRSTQFSNDSIEITIQHDTSSESLDLEIGSAVGRTIINRSVMYIDDKMGPLKNCATLNIGQRPPRLLDLAQAGDLDALARLKFHLFAYGARISDNALRYFRRERENLTIRDGIAGGLEIKLPHSVHVNIPIKEYFSYVSPYQIDVDADGNISLCDSHNERLSISVLPIPDFVGRYTSRGTPMVDVGQMFNERLSVEIFYGCVNGRKIGLGCQFCELGAETAQRYSNCEDIRELVAYCEASPVIPMRHVLIGGGTPPGKRWNLYYEALAAVRAETEVAVYMMIAPPGDLGRLDQLYHHGVNEIGMNLEVYDRGVARRIMPMKGKISLQRYFTALEHAVKLWGNAGSVRSILIVGLEPIASTLKGVEELARRGVMPILSPYRPIPGTPLSNFPPPSPELMYEAWVKGTDIAMRFGSALGPLCIACQNNTISLPFGPQYKYY